MFCGLIGTVVNISYKIISVPNSLSVVSYTHIIPHSNAAPVGDTMSNRVHWMAVNTLMENMEQENNYIDLIYFLQLHSNNLHSLHAVCIPVFSFF